jgi:hypothetical protein
MTAISQEKVQARQQIAKGVADDKEAANGN